MELFREENGRCYHIQVAKGDISPTILSCGSPERIEQIASKLKNVKVLSKNRGLLTLRGDYRGLDLTLFTSGMGPASAAIALPEILDSLADLKKPITLLRLGTAGSLQPYVKVGDLVVAKGAVRDEATTQRIAPLEFPATASIKLSLATLAASQQVGFEFGENLWHGMLHVKDELYFTESPSHSALAESRTARLQSFKRMGVMATEMEFSVFAILSEWLLASQRKLGNLTCRIDYGGLDLIVSPDHQVASSATTTFKHPDPELAIDIALQALILKQQWDQGERLEALHKVLPWI